MKLRKILVLSLAVVGFALGAAWGWHDADATVLNPTNTVSYPCTPSTPTFQVPFPYQQPQDLYVTVTASAATALNYGTDFTLNLVSTSTTATLTLVSPSTVCSSVTTNTITITRWLALTQPQSFLTQGAFYPALHEKEFDRVVMQIQQLANRGLDGGTGGAATSLAPGALLANSPITGDGSNSSHLGFSYATGNTWTGVNNFTQYVSLDAGLTVTGPVYADAGLTVTGPVYADAGVIVNGLLYADAGAVFFGPIEGPVQVDGGVVIENQGGISLTLGYDGGTTPALNFVGQGPPGSITASANGGDLYYYASQGRLLYSDKFGVWNGIPSTASSNTWSGSNNLFTGGLFAGATFSMASNISGRATLTAGTATVTSTAVTSTSEISLTNCNVNASTAIGLPTVSAIVAATSFTIKSVTFSAPSTAVSTDVSTICWTVIN